MVEVKQQLFARQFDTFHRLLYILDSFLACIILIYIMIGGINMIKIDARGKACPTPVIMTKVQIDAGADCLEVTVDNTTAMENVSKLGNSQGFAVATAQNGADYVITLTRDGSAPAEAVSQCSCGIGDWAVFAGRDIIGSGERELGESLAKMFFYTLAESADRPKYILLMNNGVKLACGDNQTIEHLQKLIDEGSEVLVCGTCLNYYGISDDLKAGSVSNMYDIVGKMQEVSKVITI